MNVISKRENKMKKKKRLKKPIYDSGWVDVVYPRSWGHSNSDGSIEFALQCKNKILISYLKHIRKLLHEGKYKYL